MVLREGVVGINANCMVISTNTHQFLYSMVTKIIMKGSICRFGGASGE